MLLIKLKKIKNLLSKNNYLIQILKDFYRALKCPTLMEGIMKFVLHFPDVDKSYTINIFNWTFFNWIILVFNLAFNLPAMQNLNGYRILAKYKINKKKFN